MYKGDRIMQETFKLFSTLREPALKDATNESLARLYQIKPSNAILAEVFCRNFKMLYLLQNKFKKVDESERVSITLVQLEKALRAYDETKIINGKLIKFSSPLSWSKSIIPFFCFVFLNKLVPILSL